MMEMADGYVHYGSFPRPLAIQPPTMDGQSSTQAASGGSPAKKKKRTRRDSFTSSTQIAGTAVLANGARQHKVGVGASFLKMFVGNISDMMFLPMGFTIEADCLRKRWFTIVGPSGASYRVWVESYLDSLVIRNGWSDLVDGEGVSQGDVGLFKREGPLEFSLTLYSRGGLEMEVEAPRHPVGPRSMAPKWEDVQFVADAKVKRTTELVGTLFGLWVNSQHPIVLYAATIKRDAVNGGPMICNRKVSARLPAGPTAIGLKFNGSRLVFPGTIAKRSDQTARIQGGWSDFAHAHKLRVGAVYVFKFAVVDDGWEVTLFGV